MVAALSIMMPTAMVVSIQPIAFGSLLNGRTRKPLDQGADRGAGDHRHRGGDQQRKAALDQHHRHHGTEHVDVAVGEVRRLRWLPT